MKYRRYICLQYDAMDCGPTCLEMVCRYHRVERSRAQLRELCSQGRHGVTLSSLARAAQEIGFRTLSVKIAFDEARATANLPAIAYLPGGHFVVIFKMTKRAILLGDPVGGLIWYKRKLFEEMWSMGSTNDRWGVMLLLTHDGVSTTFPSQISGKQVALKNLWNIAWKIVHQSLVPMCVCSVLILGTAMIAPFLSGALVDLGILPGSHQVVAILLLGQFVLTLGRITGNFCEGWLLIHLGAQLDVRLSTAFVQKLLRQPLAFFETTTSGDLAQRIDDHHAIRMFLTESTARTAFGVLTLSIFGIVLGVYRPDLLVIFFIGNSIFIVYTLSFVARQRRLNNRLFRLNATRQMITIEMLRGVSDLKLAGAEQQRSWQWENSQASIARTTARADTIALVQSSGGLVITEITNLLLLWVTAQDVMRQRLSLGSMLAVQYVIGQMTGPLTQVVNLVGRSFDALLSAERAAEIHSLSDETNEVDENAQLGDIAFHDVNFSYPGSARNAGLRNLSFTIKRGTTTAIVGPTGSGKSTILKLLLKYYQPTSGVITMNGLDLQNISATVLRSLAGVVMQDGYIFADTLVNNIVLSRTDIDWSRVNAVTELAQLSGVISNMPMGFKTPLGANGLGVSKGQAQRVLLARALYPDPELLVLDEATSALDTETESVLVKALRPTLAGKTVLIIAHRLNTVRNADNIIVLEKGCVVEEGCHEVLIRKKGRYYDLIQDQLEAHS